MFVPVEPKHCILDVDEAKKILMCKGPFLKPDHIAFHETVAVVPPLVGMIFQVFCARSDPKTSTKKMSN
jgi:hypothetical protein